MKATLGDKALLWGTLGGFLLSGIAFTAWLSSTHDLVTSTAQAQDQLKNEVLGKLDSLSNKLDEQNTRLSRMEGKLDRK
jgi:hypothetical protein